MPNLVTYLNQTLELYVVRCGSENRYGKDIFLKVIWTMCSKSANYFRLDRQHSMRGVRPFNEHRNFQPDNYEKCGYGLDLHLLTISS